MSERNDLKFVSAVGLTLLFAVGFLVFVWYKTDKAPRPTTQPQTAQEMGLTPITAADHIYGAENARFVLIEYSDYECPFCKTFHATAQRLVANNPETVRWVYRHFPLDSIHPTARRQAEAAECAANLGGNDVFWQYTDKIFENTLSNNGLDMNLLPQFASELNLDIEAFNTCYENKESAQKVQNDYRSGTQIDVRGTPAVILWDIQTDKAQLMPGALSIAQLQQIIDEWKL